MNVRISKAQLTGRTSLRYIESTLDSQRHLRYHTGGGEVTGVPACACFNIDYFLGGLHS